MIKSFWKSLALVSALCSAIFISTSAGAAVYKCTSPSGAVSYSDSPCAGGLKRKGQEWVDIESENRRIREAEKERARKAESEREAAQARRQRAINSATALGLYLVEYVVEGTASEASLTFRNSSGGTEQEDINPPWRAQFTKDRGSFLYISAQNQGRYGNVIVKILVNGVVVKTSESSANYGIASASARL